MNVDLDRQSRIRSAVRLIQRVTGRRYSGAAFLREAIDAQLAVVAPSTYNGGWPIPPDDAPLPPGRHWPNHPSQ